MRTTHRVIRFREGPEQPFHFRLVERHVHFDGRVASSRCSDFRLQRINRNRSILALQPIEDFPQQMFRVVRSNPRRHSLNRNTLWPHRFDFKSIRSQFLTNFFVDDELPWRQLDNHGHQQALRFDLSRAACFEVLFEEHSLMSDVLVYDPQTFAVHRHNETGAHLTERL